MRKARIAERHRGTRRLVPVCADGFLVGVPLFLGMSERTVKVEGIGR